MHRSSGGTLWCSSGVFRVWQLSTASFLQVWYQEADLVSFIFEIVLLQSQGVAAGFCSFFSESNGVGWVGKRISEASLSLDVGRAGLNSSGASWTGDAPRLLVVIFVQQRLAPMQCREEEEAASQFHHLQTTDLKQGGRLNGGRGEKDWMNTGREISAAASSHMSNHSIVAGRHPCAFTPLFFSSSWFVCFSGFLCRGGKGGLMEMSTFGGKH